MRKSNALKAIALAAFNLDARSGARGTPRILIAVLAVVGFLASFSSSAQSSCPVWASPPYSIYDSSGQQFCRAVAQRVVSGESSYTITITSVTTTGNSDIPVYPGAGITCTGHETATPGSGCGTCAFGYNTSTVNVTCSPLWVTTTVPSLGEICSKDCVGDPINPSIGNVYKREEDVVFAGAGAIAFRRYYNSADATGVDSVPGWHHSYDRSIRPAYILTNTPYPGVSATVSPQYSTPASACTSGFSAIQASVSAWAGASASYNDNVCVLSNGSTTIGTLQIQSYGVAYPTAGPVEYDVIRDDGQTLRYTLQNGVINNPPGVSLRLAVTGSGFTVTDDEDTVENYNTAGVLQSITTRAGLVQTISYDANALFYKVIDSFGNTLTVTRNSQGGIGSITLSGGGVVSYGYDSQLRLTTVTNLDGTSKSYVYGDSSFLNALTSLVDESGTTYSTWGYNSQEQATSTQEAGGADAQALTYNSDGSVTVTDSLGAVRNFGYTRVGDVNKVTAIGGSQCPTCQESAATTYDNAGWVSSRTDYNGNLTCYANDPVRGLEQVRVEGFAPGSTCPSSLSSYTPASGTTQRKITTVWNSTWREPQTITEPNRTTSFTFDSQGNVLTKTITDTSVTPNVARTWTHTYNSFGQALTVQGPRTDLNSTMTYAYYTCTTGYQCGQIQTITDAVGHVTTVNTYNVYGQPLTLTDPNGVVTTLTYDARMRLASRNIGTETTSYSYYPTGLLDLVTLPDGGTVQYAYDGAHRLTDITDGLGNHIHYTLDTMGNRTAENTYDPSSTLRRTHSRVINTLNLLYQDVNAAGTSAVTTTFGYDSNGNQTSVAAPLSRNTANQYDALNRLTQITDPNSGVTQLGYDANDNLASVIDPRSLTTSYSHNGFGDLTQQVSPDTGTTTNTYDSGGNLKTATDARGAVATYAYDALNRITQAAYSDQTINFTYDAGTNGIGHLMGASDANHTLAWTYDALGRVAGKGQTVGTITKSVGYAYTNGDLVTLVTPSGQTVTYGYANHQITSVAVNGTTIASGVTYFPFGSVSGWTWGNATTVSRTYDTDGKITEINTAGDAVSFGYDNAFRITGITDTGTSANSWTLGYDSLDRLTSASETGTTLGWTYDANGNRLSQTGSNASTFTPSNTSNQLNTITGDLTRTYGYDAAGNTTGYASDSFTLNQRGRVSAASLPGGTADYIYNALGQMVEKSGNGGTTLLMYDEAGHLLGEYSNTGALVEETVWMGDVPVATLQPNGSGISIYYVHTDQLNAPRVITRPSDNAIAWRWDTDPFGTVVPNQNPAGLGTFAYNLRLPGQYYLPESGLNLNYFRDYDPQTGRYVESDPLGLFGGSASTYAYVHGNPISRVDPLGLDDSICQFNPSMCTGSPQPPTPRHCVTPPAGPPGANLNNNLDLFKGATIWNIPMDNLAKNLMKRGGPWDYRTNQGQQYDAFGNFNYGAIAAQMGLPYYVAQNLAGYYQGEGPGNGTLLLSWPYGDDLAGALQIQAGYDYVADNCGCNK
jgi:RHS repeat-associated protein